MMSFVKYDICVFFMSTVLDADQAVMHVGLKYAVYMVLGEGK